MRVTQTELPEVLLVEPARFGDERGYFTESYNRRVFADIGIDVDFVQDNHSYSAKRGTLRGLHYQAPPMAQAKLVRVAHGAVRDVAVDARQGSPRYGQWVAVDLSADNGRQLFVPEGFLHGFVTLEPDTVFLYKVNNHYSKPHDGAVAWNDPDLAIDWRIDADDVTVSEKDAKAPAFAAWTSPFSFQAAQI
ncbi:MAG: dTDP-4-dehydrorhamnose 3,5-epimerase [Geminicoccaceae bacterium]